MNCLINYFELQFFMYILLRVLLIYSSKKIITFGGGGGVSGGINSNQFKNSSNQILAQ